LERNKVEEIDKLLPKNDIHAYDSFQNMCGNFYKTRNPFKSWSDEKFLSYIFNTPGKPDNSKTELRNMAKRTGQTIQYRSQAQSAMYPNKPAAVRYRTGFLYNIPDVDDDHAANVLHVLTTINNHANTGEAITNIYLFVDTGHCLLDLLRDKSLAKPSLSPPTLHVILSQASFADAYKAGKDLYEHKKYFHILQAWWYTVNIEVPYYEHPDNHMFHSELTCLMSDAGQEYPESKTIYQHWFLNNDLIWHTYNASNSNSIGQCQNDLILSNDPKNYPVHTDRPYIGIQKSSKASTFNNTHNSFTVGSPYYKSLCYQRKRSGDGFQMWFVNKFADIIQQGRKNNFACTQAGPRFGGFGTSEKDYSGRVQLCASTAQHKNITLKKSFFVTQDWMAFSWAAFCNINVIFCSNCNHATGAGAQVMIFIAQENASFY
jgi:hypothetical protein